MAQLDRSPAARSHYETFHRVPQAGEPKTAVLFGPVSPAWTSGGGCTPLVQALGIQGYDVHVVDSIPLLLEHQDASTSEIIANYHEFTVATFGNPDLIGGYAYGGTLSSAMVPMFSNVPDVVSVSGPGFIDTALHKQLNALLTVLRSGDLQKALDLLALSVTPFGSEPSTLHMDQFENGNEDLAIARMIAGFEFLLRLDVRPALHEFGGRLLALTGQQSKLATAQNLGFVPANSPSFTHIEIPHVGMRVLLEAPHSCSKSFRKWINYDQKNLNFAG